MKSRVASLALLALAVGACGDDAGTVDPSADSVAPGVETDTTGQSNETPPVETMSDPTIPPSPDEAGLATGGMQITVIATPETVDDLVPSVRLDGVDVFDQHCSRDSLFDVTSEAVYFCDDLQLAIYDVTAPPVGDIVPTLQCFPVGSFEGWDARVADVGVDGFVYCSLSAYPPGVRIQLLDVDAAAVTSVEIRDAEGMTVDVTCRRIDGPASFPRQTELQCDPLPFGSYEIPRQDVDGSGIEQPFVCLPGFETGNGPDVDNTFQLEDRIDDGSGFDLTAWTCVNEEPEGPRTGLLMLAVEAGPAIADDLRIEVVRDGVDIFGDACVSASAPGYLDPGTEGFRFYQCEGDWWGELSPAVVHAPEQAEVTVFCFEQNVVTGVTGPTAVLDPLIGEPWICRIDVIDG